MVGDFLLKLIGTGLFFLPGTLCTFILFPRTTYLKRVIFSISLSSAIAIFSGLILLFLKTLDILSVFLFYTILSLFLFIVLLLLKKNIKTSFQGSSFIILAFSVLGSLWRFFLRKFFDISGDAYGYASYLIEKSIKETGSFPIKIPNLNFYTGMVGGHADYLGGNVAKIIYEFLTFNSSSLSLFLGVLMYLGFVFLVILKLTKKEKLAYLGALIMALGPIEIWKTTSGFIGHSLAYVALFSLFLLFIYGSFAYFVFALFVAGAVIFSYYTGAMVVMIVSAGFIVSCLIFQFLKIKKISFALLEKRIFFFLLILVFSWFFVFCVSNAKEYTKRNIVYTVSAISSSLGMAQNQEMEKEVSVSLSSTMPQPFERYYGPFEISGFPLLAIEDLIFLFFGLTFVPYFLMKKDKKEEMIMALSCIPVGLLSLGFAIVNSHERAMYYFTFFAIAGIRLKEKHLKKIGLFLIMVAIIFTFLRFYQRPYLTKYESEIEAAKFVKENVRGVVFTDQHFANILILNDYYDVQGISDHDKRIPVIYKSYDPDEIRRTLVGLRADYIAITRRMRDLYILALNFPQKPMENEDIYEQYFEKIYDNGDVRIYKVNGFHNDF